MRLLKRESKSAKKTKPDTARGAGKNALSQGHGGLISLPLEGAGKMKSAVTRKDTFISPEVTLSGN